MTTGLMHQVESIFIHSDGWKNMEVNSVITVECYNLQSNMVIIPVEIHNVSKNNENYTGLLELVCNI